MFPHLCGSLPRKLDIKFSSKKLEFPDRYEAKLWVIDNQLSRRNLDKDSFNELIGKEYNLKKEGRGGDHISEEFHKARPHFGVLLQHAKTAKEVAKKRGVSKNTVQRAGALEEAKDKIKEASPKVAEQICR